MAFYDFLKKPLTYGIAAAGLALGVAGSFAYNHWISPPAISVPRNIPVVNAWFRKEKISEGVSKYSMEYFDSSGRIRVLTPSTDGRSFESLIGRVNSANQLEERANQRYKLDREEKIQGPQVPSYAVPVIEFFKEAEK